jgi:hypothetical protein
MKHILGGLAFIILSILLGLILASNAMQVATRGDQAEWQQVDLPRGYAPDHLVIGEGPYIYLMTKDGTTLAQLLRTDQIFPWEIVNDEPLEGDPLYQHASAECSLAAKEIQEAWMQKPPGVIQQQVICNYMRHAEYTGEIRYVLLDDKGLWRWAKTDLGMAGLGVFIYFTGRGIIGGGIFGLLAYIGFTLSIRTLRSGTVEETVPDDYPVIDSASILHSQGSEPIINGFHFSQYVSVLVKTLYL